jgi:hypothetical protein
MQDDNKKNVKNPLSKLRVNRLTLSKEEVAWLKDRLEEPAKDIPQLRELMNRKSVFEDEPKDKTNS